MYARQCACKATVFTQHAASLSAQAFDDLLLLKRGGHATYVGPLGRHSVHLVDYFQAVKGVEPLQEGINPGASSHPFNSCSQRLC